MQRERRISSVLNQLKKNSKNSSASDPQAIAINVLEWVLDTEKDISEIFPEIKIYKKSRNENLFDSNEGKKYIWYNPVFDVWIWEPKIPEHTPTRWWKLATKEELEELNPIPGAELTKGYFSHTPDLEEMFENLGEKFKLHWTQIDSFFEAYKTLFRNRKEVEKFLSYDFDIDNLGKAEYDIAARNLLNQAGIPFNQIKKHLSGKGMIFMYEYKRKQEIIWVFYDSKEELNEKNYYGFG